MERPAVNAAAARAAHHDGRGRIPKVMALGDEIGELIEAQTMKSMNCISADGPQAE